VLPDVELYHADGVASVIGGLVYRGDALPELRGHYLFTDLADGKLRSLLAGPDGDMRELREIGDVGSGPLGFGTDAAGEVYVGLADGRVVELVPDA
jgi:hypothetical protein